VENGLIPLLSSAHKWSETRLEDSGELCGEQVGGMWCFSRQCFDAAGLGDYASVVRVNGLWLGDRSLEGHIQPVKSYVLVYWWWQFARLIAPVLNTTSIILISNKIQNGDILVPAYPNYRGKWPLDECWVFQLLT